MPFSLPLGELFVVLTGEAKGFEKMIASAEKRVKKVAEGFISLGTKMTAAFTVPLAALGFSAIKAASDAEETKAKFGVVFASVIDGANKMATELDKDFGLARSVTEDLLSGTADLLTGFGFTQKQALGLSNQVQRLAVDLAAFTNIEGGSARASRALTSGLLGMRQSMRVLGIAITERDPEFRALVKSLQETQSLTLIQAKALATLQFAIKQSKNAIGAFKREQNSFANQMKELNNDFLEFREEIGKELLPLAKEAIAVFRGWFNEWSLLSKEQKKFTLIAAGVLAAIGPMLIVIGLLVNAMATLVSVGLAAIGVYAAWTVAILLVAAAVVIVTDLILQMTDTANLGVLDLINNFRIAGARIATWMQVAATLTFKAFASAFNFIETGLVALRGVFVQFVGRGLLVMLEKVRSGIVKMIRGVQRSAGIVGFALSSQFNKAVDFINDNFAKASGTVANVLLTEFTDTYSKLTKMDDTFKKKVAVFDKTIANTFAKDAELLRKEREKLEIPGVTVPKVETPEIKIPTLEVDKLKAKDQDFEVINLRRFNLEGSGGLAKALEQDVKAKGVEDRLDTLIDVTRTKLGTARLG